jgi:hypothetical protein
MAETEEWVQQDGEWQCVNCQVIFPEGKPWGYDYENSLVEVLPEELHDVPFWQERKYCTCCWDAWEEGYEEAVRLRHNADVLTQQMQAEDEPPAEAPSAAPAAAPAAEAPAVPLVVVPGVPMPAPRGHTHSKKVKLANGELTFEEAFPYVCTDSVCVPKPRDMMLKDGHGIVIKTYGLQMVPAGGMRFQYKQELVSLLVCNMCLQWLLSLFVLIAQAQHILHNHPVKDTLYLCARCNIWTKNSPQHRIAFDLQAELGTGRHSMWHEVYRGDPRIKNADGTTDAVLVDKKAVVRVACKKKKAVSKKRR